MNSKPIIFFISLMALTLVLVVIFQLKTDPFQNVPAKTQQEQTVSHQADAAIGLFSDNCARCHGSFGEGKGRNPSLQGNSLSHEEIASIIRSGRGEMPPFHKLSDEQVHILSALVEKMQ